MHKLIDQFSSTDAINIMVEGEIRNITNDPAWCGLDGTGYGMEDEDTSIIVDITEDEIAIQVYDGEDCEMVFSWIHPADSVIGRWIIKKLDAKGVF